MRSSSTTSTLPAWQKERQAILQRACVRINAARARGVKLKSVLIRVARDYRDKPFKADPSKRLALSPGTLRYLWRRWQQSGEVAAAFMLNYSKAYPRVAAPLLVRFAEFCALRPHASLKAAWRAFAALPKNTAKAGKISYQQVTYNFPAADFYQIRQELQTMQAAQVRLAAARLRVIGGIRARLPDRVATHRVKPGVNFEI